MRYNGRSASNRAGVKAMVSGIAKIGLLLVLMCALLVMAAMVSAGWWGAQNQVAFTPELERRIVLLDVDRRLMVTLINTRIDSHYSWSPDGQRLAFTDMRDGQSTRLHVLDLRTGQVEPFASNDLSYDSEVAWSNGGRYLVVTAFQPVGSEHRWQLLRFDTISGQMARIDSYDTGGSLPSVYPEWAPDDSAVLLHIRHARSLRQVNLKTSTVREFEVIPIGARVEWIEAETLLLFSQNRDRSSRLCYLDLTTIDYECGQRFGYGFSPLLSPDGRWIVFYGSVDGRSGLYVARPDGSAPRQIYDGHVRVSYTWRP
jgi:Tol biopolymer transport system component